MEVQYDAAKAKHWWGKPVGRVHEQLPFWQKELGCDPYLTRVLQEGYEAPKKTDVEWPAHYQEENNRSAMENMAFVQAETMRLWEEGMVVETIKPPTFINPLTVVVRDDGKKRLVLDLSRCVNKLVQKTRFKMDDLKIALELTEPGDFQVIADMSSCYHHVRIKPSDYKYYGFCVPYLDKTRYYVYVVLHFGLGPATVSYTHLTLPTNREV